MNCLGARGRTEESPPPPPEPSAPPYYNYDTLQLSTLLQPPYNPAYDHVATAVVAYLAYDPLYLQRSPRYREYHVRHSLYEGVDVELPPSSSSAPTQPHEACARSGGVVARSWLQPSPRCTAAPQPTQSRELFARESLLWRAGTPCAPRSISLPMTRNDRIDIAPNAVAVVTSGPAPLLPRLQNATQPQCRPARSRPSRTPPAEQVRLVVLVHAASRVRRHQRRMSHRRIGVSAATGTGPALEIAVERLVRRAVISVSRARGAMSDREYLTEPLDAEEERAAEAAGGGLLHVAVRSYMYTPMGGDSDSPDDDTLKCTVWNDNPLVGGVGGGGAAANSESDSTSSSSDADDDSGENDGGRFTTAPRALDTEYRTLTPSGRLDTSTRCDADFRWLRSGDTPPEKERASSERQRTRERGDEFGSGSLDRRRRRAADRGERDRKTRSSLSAKPPQHPTSAGASPRRGRALEPPRHGDETPHELQRRWNSYEHFRWPDGGGGGGGGWWPVCWCHAPPPPCCARDHPPAPSPWMPYPAHLSGSGNSSHTPCKNDAEERVRRLEGDKESLQLQVQVLSEQISAQADKIADLERALHDARQRVDNAEDSLQKEMLARSSLETQKLELLSKLSEARLRAAERGVLERSPPPPEHNHVPHPPPPRTPPANYGRQIERNTHAYSSLPRAAQAPDVRAVAFAEKDEVIPPRGSPSPSLRGAAAGNNTSPWARLTRAGSGGAGGGAWLEGGELTRGGVRATAAPRLQRDHTPYPWQTLNVKEWDVETTCSWLESLSLEPYIAAARSWLGASPDVRGLIASATPHTIEKELALKHPMHRKKIVLALMDLQQQNGDVDGMLSAAGKLDTAWVLRWMEDAGLAGVRDAAAEAALDGRTLHRLTHDELHTHLRVHTQLHALSVRRGIQVLRENNFSADTMVRRGPERSAGEVEAEAAAAAAGGGGEAGEVEAGELARWSSHRVMQWLKEIDLAEYAPNLRGAGVHGGLMLYEPRFTAELLATLLNIPASKTLLRRHITQRFNDLLGREVIQLKRNAEQTLGYQPLTITSKYKVPKKSQFSLKRRKSKDELELGELVCPLHVHEEGSGDAHANSARTTNSKAVVADASAASQLPDTYTQTAP